MTTRRVADDEISRTLCSYRPSMDDKQHHFEAMICKRQRTSQIWLHIHRRNDEQEGIESSRNIQASIEHILTARDSAENKLLDFGALHNVSAIGSTGLAKPHHMFPVSTPTSPEVSAMYSLQTQLYVLDSLIWVHISHRAGRVDHSLVNFRGRTLQYHHHLFLAANTAIPHLHFPASLLLSWYDLRCETTSESIGVLHSFLSVLLSFLRFRFDLLSAGVFIAAPYLARWLEYVLSTVDGSVGCRGACEGFSGHFRCWSCENTRGTSVRVWSTGTICAGHHLRGGTLAGT